MLRHFRSPLLPSFASLLSQSEKIKIINISFAQTGIEPTTIVYGPKLRLFLIFKYHFIYFLIF